MVKLQAIFALRVWRRWCYYGDDDKAIDADGYFDTGDIATIDREGFMTITYRAKELGVRG